MHLITSAMSKASLIWHKVMHDCYEKKKKTRSWASLVSPYELINQDSLMEKLRLKIWTSWLRTRAAGRTAVTPVITTLSCTQSSWQLSLFLKNWVESPPTPPISWKNFSQKCYNKCGMLLVFLWIRSTSVMVLFKLLF